MRDLDFEKLGYLPGAMPLFASPPPDIHAMRELLWHERLLALLSVIFCLEYLVVGGVVLLGTALFSYGFRAVLTAPVLGAHIVYYYVSRCFRRDKKKKIIIRLENPNTPDSEGGGISLHGFADLLADSVVTKVEAKAKASDGGAANNGSSAAIDGTAPLQQSPPLPSARLPNSR